MKIGNYAWIQEQGGRLSFKEKLKLIHLTMLPSIRAQLEILFTSQQTHVEVDFEQIQLPDSALIRHAVDLLDAQENVHLAHHSWRSYYWGAAFAQLKDQKFDTETLLCAALYHDIGLIKSPALHPPIHCHCFTYASAEYFDKQAQEFNYDEVKKNVVKDAICMHMNGSMDQSQPAEVQLLQLGTACDVIGQHYIQLPQSYRHAVHSQYPRKGFAQAFSNLVVEESRLHPSSRTALLKQLGLSWMIKRNPLDHDI